MAPPTPRLVSPTCIASGGLSPSPSNANSRATMVRDVAQIFTQALQRLSATRLRNAGLASNFRSSACSVLSRAARSLQSLAVAQSLAARDGLIYARVIV